MRIFCRKLVNLCHIIFPLSLSVFLRQDIWKISFFLQACTRKKDFTEDTSICVLWGGEGGGAHIFFPVCESVQLISLWGQMWVSVKSLHSSGRGSLNLNTKDHHFVWLTEFQYIQTIPWSSHLESVQLVQSAKCLSRVHCAWNCWGWGLIWVRGLSARASHSYGGASSASPCHPHGWAVKARYERRHCVQNPHLATLHIT